MSNIKKCDRCGKTYPWDYKAKHAVVMVYDDEKHLHHTDLCPECDKAAAEWMKKGKNVAIGRLTLTPSNVKFAFENRKVADDFIAHVRSIAQLYGVATMIDAKEIYADIRHCVVETNYSDIIYGWYETSLNTSAVLKTQSGWSVSLPEPVRL